jgi:hypothetical protein
MTARRLVLFLGVVLVVGAVVVIGSFWLAVINSRPM